MKNHFSKSLYELIILLMMLALLTSCGGEKGQDGDDEKISIIETAVPGVYFEIPEGALPAGLDPADIRIEPTSPPADFPNSDNGADIQAWKLLPGGTRFEKPVNLVVPYGEILPSFLHIQNNERSWVSEVVYKLSPKGHKASVSLESFSELVVSLDPAWGQAFEFFPGVPDTPVGELVEARLKVAMKDVFLTAKLHNRVPEWQTSVLLFEVDPGSKTVCGVESFPQPCSVFSGSDNLEWKDMAASVEADNIHPQSQSFEEDFTLAYDGFRCTETGPANISFKFSVWWKGDEKYLKSVISSHSDGHTYPGKYRGDERTYFEIDVPMNCVERRAVTLVDVQQRATANAYSREAASNDEVWEYKDQEYLWSSFYGESGELVDTDYKYGVPRETRTPAKDTPVIFNTYSPNGYNTVIVESKASLAEGTKTTATFFVDTMADGPGLTILGEILLNNNYKDIDQSKFLVSGDANADLSLTVAVREPSAVRISNCELFERSIFQQFADFQYAEGRCTFSVEGSSAIKLPGEDGLPDISLLGVPGVPEGEMVQFILDKHWSNNGTLKENFIIWIEPETPETIDSWDENLIVIF